MLLAIEPIWYIVMVTTRPISTWVWDFIHQFLNSHVWLDVMREKKKSRLSRTSGQKEVVSTHDTESPERQRGNLKLDRYKNTWPFPTFSSLNGRRWRLPRASRWAQWAPFVFTSYPAPSLAPFYIRSTPVRTGLVQQAPGSHAESSMQTAVVFLLCTHLATLSCHDIGLDLSHQVISDRHWFIGYHQPK